MNKTQAANNNSFISTTNINNTIKKTLASEFKDLGPKGTMIHNDPRASNSINQTEENKKAGNAEKPEIAKIKKPRLKLDERLLFYSENGIKKYYDVIMNTEFKESHSDVSLEYNYLI